MTKIRAVDPVGALFGIALPVLAAVAVLVLTRVWEPKLPDEVATNWSGSTPSSFGDPMSSAWTMALLIVLVGGGCCAIAALSQALLLMRRYMLVVGLGVTGVMTASHLAGLAGQLDRGDASQATFPAWSVAVGAILGISVGWIGAALLRDNRERKRATSPPPADLPRSAVELPLVDRVGTSTSLTVALMLTALVPTLMVCAATGSWWVLVLVAAGTVLLVGLLRFTVIVDERGIRVRNLATDAVVYDLDEIVGADVTETRPFQDWGGWGLRSKGRGRYGLVTEGGPAVVVTTASGHVFTVTSRRAQEMAGALNTLADRRHDDAAAQQKTHTE